MKYVYEIVVRLPAATLITPLKEVEETVNTHLAMCGYEEEKLKIGLDVPFEMKANRELTLVEIESLKELMKEQTKAFSGEVVSVRRKSGNVSQEVASVS